MGTSFGSQIFLLICGTLVALPAALAVVQYRGSTRVAAADARRRRGTAAACDDHLSVDRGAVEVEMGLSEDLPPVPGDAKPLRSAFDNLLDNALKNAGGGRWIRVSAGYEVLKKRVGIRVEDRGAGIDPADQKDIFEPFCRGRAAMEARIPGSGLGLSLVRSAAEAHRSSVTLDSGSGRGNTFTMHLPA